MKFKLNNSKSNIISSYIFALIFFLGGLLFLILYLVKASETNSWITVDSVVKTVFTDKVDVEYFVESQAQKVISTLNEYNTAWKVGSVIPIKYNPINVTEIVSNTSTANVVPYVAASIFMLIGLVLILTTTRNLILKKRNFQENPDGSLHIPESAKSLNKNMYGSKMVSGSGFNKVEEDIAISSFIASQISSNEKEKPETVESEHLEDLTLHPNGKTWVLENSENKIVYSFNKEDNSLIKGSLYSFKNNLTNNSALHRISNSIVSSSGYSSPIGITPFYFKIDGEIVWDYLSGHGVNIIYSKEDNSYEVKVNNKSIGVLKHSKDYRPNAANNFHLSKECKFFYVDCEKDYLDVLMVCAFAIVHLLKVLNNQHLIN